jgi:hypothetical protein
LKRSQLAAGLVALGLIVPVTAEGRSVTTGRGQALWSWSLAAGYDTYIHTFPLATDDTTTTVTELALLVGLEGQATPGSIHQWRVRPEFSYGTELWRGRIDASYQYRPEGRSAVFRLDGYGLARTYQGGTDDTLTSDTIEGWLTARGFVSPAGTTMGELQLRAGGVQYWDPSVLEVSYHDFGGAAFLRAGRDATTQFSLGGRVRQRAYPDSSAIDRTMAALEGEFDNVSHTGRGVRLFQRSERRLIRNEAVRPSAWNHWSTLEWLLPLGSFDLTGDIQSEIWQYDGETAVYFNSWRLNGVFLMKVGGLAAWTWRAGLAAELLSAGDSPESYQQAGMRAGVEHYGTRFTVAASVEYGLRDYRLTGSVLEVASNNLEPVQLPLFTYTDFNYWELWLMATWTLAPGLSLDVLANYEPERHTERIDDASLAFLNMRLVWRP